MPIRPENRARPARARRQSSTPDLFGPPPPVDRRRDGEPVTLPLRFLTETEDAFFLAANRSSATAKWVPKKLARRGDGPEAGLFTMPRGIARERGWLT